MNYNSEISIDSFEQYDINYAMHLDEKAITDRLPPLIVALHWGGPNYKNKGLDFLKGFALHAFSGVGAALLAPDCPFTDWSDPRSGDVVFDLLEIVFRDHAIDSNRILITGYSMGGIGSWQVGGQRQEVFVGILPIAAQPPASVLDITWTIPLYTIHGERDEIFPIANAKSAVETLQQSGADVQMITVDGISHFETHRFIATVQDAIPWIKDKFR